MAGGTAPVPGRYPRGCLPRQTVGNRPLVILPNPPQQRVERLRKRCLEKQYPGAQDSTHISFRGHSLGNFNFNSGSTPKIDSTRRAAAAKVLPFSINHLFLCSGSTLLWIYFDLFDELFRIIVVPYYPLPRYYFCQNSIPVGDTYSYSYSFGHIALLQRSAS